MSQDLFRVAQVHAEAASQLLRATVPAVQEGDQRLPEQCSATSRAREDRPVHAEGGGEALVVRRFRTHPFVAICTADSPGTRRHHKINVKWMKSFFSYLDRFHTKRVCSQLFLF